MSVLYTFIPLIPAPCPVVILKLRSAFFILPCALSIYMQAFMRMDENLTRFNSLFAGDGPNRLFVYFQATDPAEEVLFRGGEFCLWQICGYSKKSSVHNPPE